LDLPVQALFVTRMLDYKERPTADADYLAPGLAAENILISERSPLITHFDVILNPIVETVCLNAERQWLI
jgi:hypothetical protein